MVYRPYLGSLLTLCFFQLWSMLQEAVVGMQSRGLQHAWLGVLLVVIGGLFCHGLYFVLKRYLVRQVRGRLLQGRKNRQAGEEDYVRSLSDGDVAEISVK